MGIKIDPKKPGTYVVTYSKRHPTTAHPTNLRRKGFKTMADAKRAFNQMVLDVDEKVRRKHVPTWQVTTQAYLEFCLERGLALKTIEDYKLCLRAHTFEDWGERLIDSITTQEVRELMSARLEKKSISQQKSVLKMIRGVFNYALESGSVQRNPTPHLSFKTGDKIRRVLTEPQTRMLLERAKQMEWEWYPHWVMAIYTGMRSGELYALTWDKVNLDDQHIVVDCSWNSIDGFKSTKSGDDRVVDLSPTLVSLLKEWKLQRNDSTFVLPRLRKWDKGEQARELRMFLMGLGIPPVRFHDLRATWATMMLSKGVEPVKVMSMGGWKDMKTMMVYIRKAGIDVRGIASVLSDLHNPSIEGAKVLKLGARSDS